MIQQTKSSLSPQRQRLVELMQKINFGRITNLMVQRGEPQITSTTFIEREVKFGGQNGPRPEYQAADFTLKQELVDLFDQMSTIGNFTIRQLEVKHGLPFLMRLDERAV
jgi:hypothetical protein